jgi:hypothetical protein
VRRRRIRAVAIQRQSQFNHATVLARKRAGPERSAQAARYRGAIPYSLFPIP